LRRLPGIASIIQTRNVDLRHESKINPVEYRIKLQACINSAHFVESSSSNYTCYHNNIECNQFITHVCTFLAANAIISLCQSIIIIAVVSVAVWMEIEHRADNVMTYDDRTENLIPKLKNSTERVWKKLLMCEKFNIKENITFL
jgi:hypothetical protein